MKVWIYSVLILAVLSPQNAKAGVAGWLWDETVELTEDALDAPVVAYEEIKEAVKKAEDIVIPKAKPVPPPKPKKVLYKAKYKSLKIDDIARDRKKTMLELERAYKANVEILKQASETQ